MKATLINSMQMISEKTINLVRDALGLPGDPASHRVVVAMSGGVDSSVAAGLVKAAGFDAIGITLQLYDHGEAIARKGACCAGQDIHDARQVAEHLGMPHYVLDYESRFADSVINDFIDSYLVGETPIPCITCNQTVKFADLLRQSRELGAVALVTGHYVENRARGDESGHFDMLTPYDMARDQSYFLFATTQEQLDYLRFPLAKISKEETRQIALDLGLDIAAKPDSQDICFVPNGNYGDVIRKLRPEADRPGSIVHEDGRVLGEHGGIIDYTIGQRRGLGIADKAPLYVNRLDPQTATVYVGPKQTLLRNCVLLKDLNWIAPGDWNSVSNTDTVYVKLRSTRPAAPATINNRKGEVAVKLDEGEYGLSPGQACVIYDGPGPGAKVLGGGFIASALQV
ncbi:tRNA-specific 2-thiouridylase MnmA [hydrothermal vent metagenome]|uniref:tRNA-specific 2-thiouridylase MnmA n=1 Tax=hydrothermal vent metagenome TaxID=652676 RepID=A0A3B0SHP1_9ZZZZ